MSPLGDFVARSIEPGDQADSSWGTHRIGVSLGKKPRIFRELFHMGSSIQLVEFGYHRLIVLVVEKRNRGVLRAHVID